MTRTLLPQYFVNKQAFFRNKFDAERVAPIPDAIHAPCDATCTAFFCARSGNISEHLQMNVSVTSSMHIRMQLFVSGKGFTKRIP
jgi:hypothetical protein